MLKNLQKSIYIYISHIQDYNPGYDLCICICFEPTPLIELNLPVKSNANLSEASVTRRVMGELNCTYQSTFNHSFTNSVLKYCGTGRYNKKRHIK